MSISSISASILQISKVLQFHYFINPYESDIPVNQFMKLSVLYATIAHILRKHRNLTAVPLFT